ncbi:hypothetical protein NL676_017514 [Syzygium grande]|nr:hypothetical protein NL676_017514 [Syzygium grande]
MANGISLFFHEGNRGLEEKRPLLSLPYLSANPHLTKTSHEKSSSRIENVYLITPTNRIAPEGPQQGIARIQGQNAKTPVRGLTRRRRRRGFEVN